jgi:3-methyladenine DNA glycosylase/8-oxoguanine DNA glycosylase
VKDTDKTRQTLTRYLTVHPPYDHLWIFDFLKRRAVPPYEIVEDLCYCRCLGGENFLRVEWIDNGLRVQIPAAFEANTDELLNKVHRIFDLDADSALIDAMLGKHKALKPYMCSGGGLRVPGGWSGFELGVRAIFGQQVSVARATHLMTGLVEHYSADGQFPGADLLALDNPSHLGMPRKRGAAVQIMAQRVNEGVLNLDAGSDAGLMRQGLLDIPGIGPWTAEYIAMRAAKDPDAFPEKDWVVLKTLEMKPREAQNLAELWRPWRAYALMYLWRGK